MRCERISSTPFALESTRKRPKMAARSNVNLVQFAPFLPFHFAALISSSMLCMLRGIVFMCASLESLSPPHPLVFLLPAPARLPSSATAPPEDDDGGDDERAGECENERVLLTRSEDADEGGDGGWWGRNQSSG